MKKTFNLLLTSMLLAIVACGPNQEQKAAKASQDFKTFLPTFLEAVKAVKNQDVYLHKELGVYVYNNPGTVCVAANANKIANMDGMNEIPVTNIFDRKPKGNFCEGYPGEKDGFYFVETTKDDLPTYFDMERQTGTKVVLPKNLDYKKFIKVTVIKGESFYVELYFTFLDSTWYLIGQNFCDCSA